MNKLNHWTDFFDQIFLINLPHDKDRLQAAREQLSACSIPFYIVEGIYAKNPEDGIRQTVKKIFQHSLMKGHKRILVFEDDLKFVSDPSLVMPNVIDQIGSFGNHWDVLYLGVNTHQPFKRFCSPNLLPIEEGYGLHAVAYNQTAMKELIRHFDMDKRAIDVVIADALQTKGTCLATYPLIATQHSGYSNIQQKNMDQSYIIERYNKNIAHLIRPKW